MLTEIPTGNETFDNIVAFWNPKKPLAVGKEHLFSYTLTWGEQPPVQPDKLAQVQATRTGLGGVIGQQRDVFSWRFAIDFGGGGLSMLGADAELEAAITTSSGKVEIASVRPLDSIKGYRAMFDLVPGESSDPIDIRLQLMLSGQPVSEVWLYQYTPPPVEEQARLLAV
jgi:glucans biosynthesis protein